MGCMDFALRARRAEYGVTEPYEHCASCWGTGQLPAPPGSEFGCPLECPECVLGDRALRRQVERYNTLALCGADPAFALDLPQEAHPAQDRLSLTDAEILSLLDPAS